MTQGKIDTALICGGQAFLALLFDNAYAELITEIDNLA